MSETYHDSFVTVVSVGVDAKPSTQLPPPTTAKLDYVTVLTIGTHESVTEEVLVYRLPGERLGFGLKFEGGTKAHEFVKRLFIQSCAPDSPASRVHSTWGPLVEGDEVLEIDCIPVNSMTRIDCVRFLKDSNVAIKLLVKHTGVVKNDDVPLIVNEDRKPPPVPPRKVHRKLLKQNDEGFSLKSARLQSPRNSFKKKYSPDVHRRLSDGCLGPPDAEVYLDLISQESTLSLSESDDTGSTISTVLDRFASFPTTTSSSFAGSLPTTPTSIQKHLDLTYIINEFSDDDFVNNKKLIVEENNNIIEPEDEVDDEPKRPVIIPRARDRLKHSDLPRLVDFVPKSPQKDLDRSVETVTRFLDSERFDFEYTEEEIDDDEDDYAYNSKWMLSSHLSTIGEDDEEHGHQQEFPASFGVTLPPRVSIEANDSHRIDDYKLLTIDKQVPMEIPPSDSRQPPDGHEFPDFVETFKTTWTEPVIIRALDRNISSSNCDLRTAIMTDEDPPIQSNLLHNRSHSLIDMTMYSKERNTNSKWNTLMEQRKSRLSKLKGLVIPETAENDVTPSVNIPEIKSVETSIDFTVHECPYPDVKPSINKPIQPVVLQAWASNIPKYSPAFKRKSLQVYPVTKRSDSSDADNSYDEYSSSRNTLDDPKSLESIASPTRSDYSFDYSSLKNTTKENVKDWCADSDNDSAVSSSQSSYNSRSSPTPSCVSENGQNRLLKPTSVEAINRKNILASAKCRSGKDIKIGSPVIQRKSSLEEDELEQPTIEDRKHEDDDEDQGKVEDLSEKSEPRPIPMKRTHLSSTSSSSSLSSATKPEESRYDSLVQRLSAAKKNQPVNVRSLRANFENAASQSGPIFPKNYNKTNEVKMSQPVRRRSEDTTTPSPPIVLRRPSTDNSRLMKQLTNQETKRLSGGKELITPIKKIQEIKKDGKPKTVELMLDEVNGILGISLAGGVDDDNKSITINRIRYGSVAYQDGQLKRGDKVISINGQLTAGLSQNEATELLKAPSIKTFTIVVEESTEPTSNLSRRISNSTTSIDSKVVINKKASTHKFKIIKDGAGLGFSIEGGKDSPKGDVPLIVKKIFAGGAADKSGDLKVGDEILAVNNIDFQCLTRIEGWSQMKKFPDGEVTIEIYR